MDFAQIQESHNDIVHDIAFDYYGKRFASCSTDKSIKIWSLDHFGDTWNLQHDLPRAHSSSVWRLCFADPEFGQLLASCSDDSTVILWEEQEPLSLSGDAKLKWKPHLINSASKKSVNDIQFCNKHLGLLLASVSGDGYVRIYEPVDSFDMSKWNLKSQYQVEMTAVTVNCPVTGKYFSEHGLTCLAWNNCPFESHLVAVGGYSKYAVVLSLCDGGNRIEEVCSLGGEHEKPVHDIAWAPVMGRSYHLIATACRQQKCHIHKLLRLEDGSLRYDSSEIISDNGGFSIWRVAWNATGTVLATSAENGKMTLWRKDFEEQWINVQNLPSNSQREVSFFDF